MINGGANAGFIVEQNGAGFGVFEAELSQYERDLMKSELIKHRFLFAEGQHGDAFDLALDHAPHAGGENGWIAVRRADENLIAVGNGDLFEVLDQFGKEWVGDVLDDDSENAAAARDQAARMTVGEVVQLLDGLPDTLGKPLAHQRGAIDCPGDRRNRYLGH